MTVLPISVFIIARDEADRIPYTLQSVQGWVDEIIVVDSGSEDETVSVSESAGAKVLFRHWDGYGPQKVYAESKCKNDWILNLDADEAVSPELKQELIELFSTPDAPEAAAYHIPIKLMSRFQRKPSKFAPSNNPIRLYQKTYAGFKDSAVHDSVVLKDDSQHVGYLKHCYYHRCFRSYTHAVEKINRYSTMQAHDIVERGKHYSTFRLIMEPYGAFFKAYFLRRYWLLGVDGFVESVIYAFARLLRLAKVRELRKGQ